MAVMLFIFTLYNTGALYYIMHYKAYQSTWHGGLIVIFLMNHFEESQTFSVCE